MPARVEWRRIRQGHCAPDNAGAIALWTDRGRECVGLGVLGIVAGLLTGSETWIVIFAAGSIMSQFVGRPRMSDLRAAVRRAGSHPAS